jgi:hypothetical protein
MKPQEPIFFGFNPLNTISYLLKDYYFPAAMRRRQLDNEMDNELGTDQ